ncbi:unnamed protein product [Blepharisma stoltei]|uniref:STIL N-terminal domain-containing protein n=1 Tax=Blepharisma stoltei TaxID=1481888 RepID=A0AAU9JKZ9_9CILI|nr:unnamed protein product [Blepharisma stoltei]
MDNYKEQPFTFDTRTLPIIKQINLSASKCSLWPRTPTGKKILLTIPSMLPVIKFSPEVLESLYTAGHRENSQIAFGGFLAGSKYSSTHYLSVKITECQWHTRTPRSTGEYTIRLFLRDMWRLEADKREFEFMLQSLMFKLDSYAELEYLEPLDLCKATLSFSVHDGRLLANCQLLFPSINLQFVPIPILKIVSTPLSIQLTQKSNKKAKFQTGYLTLDQKKRVLPLLCSDPLAFRYPLVGVWAVGVPGNQPYPLTHPLVWASCVRFIESKLIQDRISPSPDQNTFLFVYFSSKPTFYEVSTQDKPAWCIANSNIEASRENGTFASETCMFLKSKLENDMLASPKVNVRKPRNTLSPSVSSDGHSSIKDMPIRSARSSIETCNGISTENLIIEQSEMLKRLEKQIQELQHQICYTQLESPKSKISSPARLSPKMVNSSTNTTIDKKLPPNRILFPEKRPGSTNTSFLGPNKEKSKLPPRIPRIPNLRLPTEGSESSETSPKSSFTFASNPISTRHSYSPESSLDSPRFQAPPLTTTRSSQRGNSDVTIAIPKIIYESSSDTSDDDDIKQLQKKYLKTE